MPPSVTFTPDRTTVALLATTSALLTLFILPFLYLICRLRDVGYVSRIRPLLLARHTLAGFLCIGIVIARVVTFASSTNVPVIFTTRSCEVFFTTFWHNVKTLGVRASGAQLRSCVVDAYLAPLQLVTSSASHGSSVSRSNLAHPIWWRRVSSVWEPILFVVMQSVACTVILATFINLLTTLWQDAVRNVEIAIRTGQLKEYTRLTPPFLHCARYPAGKGVSMGSAGHSGSERPSRKASKATTSTDMVSSTPTDSDAPYELGMGKNDGDDDQDKVVHNHDEDGDDAEEDFDNSVRIRGRLSARRALAEQVERRFAGDASSSTTSESESAKVVKPISSSRSPLHSLWHSLRLPSFGRSREKGEQETKSGDERTDAVTSPTAATTTKSVGQLPEASRRADLNMVNSCTPTRHVTFGVTPHEDSTTNNNFSFGSVSSSARNGEMVTVRPRLNVQNLELQQRLLKAQQKQKQRQRRDRRERHERELLTSFWISHTATFVYVAIPCLVVCVCRIALLLISVQLARAMTITNVPGPLGGPAPPPSSNHGVVAYIAPIDGYLALAGVTVLVCDHVAAARFKRAVLRLHKSQDARAAIPRVRPPVALTSTMMFFLLLAQLIPQEIRLWAAAAAFSAVCLCITMTFFAYDAVRRTVSEYDAEAQGHSKLALLFSPFYHPVDKVTVDSQRAIEKVFASAQENRRSRRVVLATQAATAAESAAVNARTGNPMEAQGAAALAAQAAHQLLREELDDEVTGGIGAPDDVDAASHSHHHHNNNNSSFAGSSPFAGSLTLRGVGNDGAVEDTMVNVVPLSMPPALSLSGDASLGVIPLLSPLGNVSTTGLGDSSTGAGNAADNFWEDIASRVHAQYGAGEPTAGFGVENSSSAFPQGTVPVVGSISPAVAMLDPVAVDMGAEVHSPTGWSSVSTQSGRESDGTAVAYQTGTRGSESSSRSFPLTSASVAVSAAVASALMPEAPAEGIDDVSESSVVNGTADSDSTGESSSGDRQKLSNSSFLHQVSGGVGGASLPSQRHLHIRRAQPLSPSDAISATALGDLHGSILLQAPLAVSGGHAATTASATTSGEAGPLLSSPGESDVSTGERTRRMRDDPLHAECVDGRVTNDSTATTAGSISSPSSSSEGALGATTLRGGDATRNNGNQDGTNAEVTNESSSSVPSALKKSFALLTRPVEWLGGGLSSAGSHSTNGKDIVTASSAATTTVSNSSSPPPGSVGTSGYNSRSPHQPRELPPMLILDPPSEEDVTTLRDVDEDAPPSAVRGPDMLSDRQQSTLQSSQMTTTTTSSSSALSLANSAAKTAFVDEGHSAAVIATAVKAARALRAVAVGNADEGFPLFLSAVRQSGNNVTLLRELMGPTGTLYARMTDSDGRTALHHATLGNYVHGINFLLEMGADPNARDDKGLTPLHLAVVTQCDHPVHPDIDDDPSHTTQQEGRRRRRADGPQSPSGGTALVPPRGTHFTASHRPVSTATTIDPETGTVAGFPATGGAVSAINQTRRPHRTWWGIINVLVRGGADVNAVTKDGRTPLHMAIADELIGALQTLLRMGADPLAAWEQEDAAEVLKPGSGHWVNVHITNSGVISGDSFCKSPLLYALEVGSALSVTSIIAFMQLQEELVRDDEVSKRRSRFLSRQSTTDNVQTLTSLLKRKTKNKTSVASGKVGSAATLTDSASPLARSRSENSISPTTTPTTTSMSPITASATDTPNTLASETTAATTTSSKPATSKTESECDDVSSVGASVAREATTTQQQQQLPHVTVVSRMGSGSTTATASTDTLHTVAMDRPPSLPPAPSPQQQQQQQPMPTPHMGIADVMAEAEAEAAQSRAAEAVNASALVPLTKRRRRVIAKTTARAVASTANVVAAAVANVQAARRRERVQQTQAHFHSLAPSRRSSPILAPLSLAMLELKAKEDQHRQTKPERTTLSTNQDGSVKHSSHRDGTGSSPASVALNDFAGAWGQQFMPQCLHGLTILDVALLLGQANVIETLVRHYDLWFQQIRLRDGELGKRKTASREEEELELDELDAMAAELEGGVVTDERWADGTRNPTDADGGVSLHSGSSTRLSTASSPPPQQQRRGPRHRRQSPPTERDFNAHAQSMLLPTLAGMGVNVVPGVVEAVRAYANVGVTSPTGLGVHAIFDGLLPTSAGLRGLRQTTAGLGHTHLGDANNNNNNSSVSGDDVGESRSPAFPCSSAAGVGIASPQTDSSSGSYYATPADARDPVSAAAAVVPSSILHSVETAASAVEGLHDASAVTTSAMVTANAMQRRQTLFHYLAVGDSTEAAAHILAMLGMPDFVPEVNHFSGYDTAWCVQHPHRTRDTRLVAHNRSGNGAAAGSLKKPASLTSSSMDATASGLMGSGVFFSTSRLTKAATGVYDANRGNRRTAVPTNTPTTMRAPTFAGNAGVDDEGGPLPGFAPNTLAATHRSNGSGGASSEKNTTSNEPGPSSASETGSNAESETTPHAFFSHVVALIAHYTHKWEKEAKAAAQPVSELGDSSQMVASPTWDPAAMSSPLERAGAALHASQQPHLPLSHSQTSSQGLGSSGVRLSQLAGRAGRLRSSPSAGTFPSPLGQRGPGSGSGGGGVRRATGRVAQPPSVSGGNVSTESLAYDPWRHAQSRIAENRQQRAHQPAMYGHAPNLLRAVPMSFSTAVIKLRQRMPNVPIDLLHLAALEASVDHVCHSAVDMAGGGKEIHRLQRALLVVSLHLQQQLLGQRARRRRAQWHPSAVGTRMWRVRPTAAARAAATTANGNDTPRHSRQTSMATVVPLRISVPGSPTLSESAAGGCAGSDLPDTTTTVPMSLADNVAAQRHALRTTIARVMLALNSIDENGLTPLHYVIANRNASMVFILCCHGAVFTFASQETRHVLAAGTADGASRSTSDSRLNVGRDDHAETASSALSGNSRHQTPVVRSPTADPRGADTACPSRDMVTASPSTSTHAAVVSLTSHGSDGVPHAAGSSSTQPSHSITASTATIPINDATSPRRDAHQDSGTGSTSESVWVDTAALPALVLSGTPITDSQLPALEQTARALSLGEALEEEEEGKTIVDEKGVLRRTETCAPVPPTTTSTALSELPSTPRLDSFLTPSSPPHGEERVGLQRVSVPETAEAKASLEQNAAPAESHKTAPTSPLTKPPLAPTTPTVAQNRSLTALAVSGAAYPPEPPAAGATASAAASVQEESAGSPLLEIFSPYQHSSMLGAHTSSDHGSYNSAVATSDIGPGRHAARESASTLSGLEKGEDVEQAGLVLQRYCEAYASQMSAPIRNALALAAEARSARRLLEALELVARPPPPSDPAAGAAAAATGEGEEEGGGSNEGTPQQQQQQQPVSCPLALPLPGALMEPHDIFVLHTVHDVAKAASIIHAGIEGMAVWKRRASELAVSNDPKSQFSA